MHKKYIFASKENNKNLEKKEKSSSPFIIVDI
jgi:hypothetical protein